MMETDFEEFEEEWTCNPRLRAKVCLVGDAGVGKTSLIRRFVVDQFDNKYIKTIGTKVSKKSISVHDKDHDRKVEVVLTIWDIMGQEGFRELLKDAYFTGANGIFAVCDITNKESMHRLDGWLDRTYRIAGDVPISIMVNKIDLKENRKLDGVDLEQFCKAYDSPCYYTSAKTGEHVPDTFYDMARRILVNETYGRNKVEVLEE